MDGEATWGAPAAGRLSPREDQVLRAMLDGLGEKQIAHRLGISQHTVHIYVKMLYRRFNVCGRQELASLWIAPQYRSAGTAPVPLGRCQSTTCPHHAQFCPGC